MEQGSSDLERQTLSSGWQKKSALQSAVAVASEQAGAQVLFWVSQDWEGWWQSEGTLQ